jgi:hypothetical protein
MPTIPWKSYQANGPGECHCLTSVLPLNHYRDVPRFLLWALRIRRQLGHSAGILGYSLKAELSHKRFWTLSAWASSEEMIGFVRSGHHNAMLEDMRGRLGQSTFREWDCPQTDLPLSWKSANERLRTSN